MRKIIYFSYLSLFILAFSLGAKAEESPDFEGVKSAVFAELLGNGLFFTLNYDRRIAGNFGLRAGAGYIGSLEGDGGILTIPVNANFLLGREGRYFEVGGGVTYLNSAGSEIFDSGNQWSISLTFMYRRQPLNGGFMWRAGFTPLIFEKTVIPYYVGFGLGYAF